MTVQARYCDEVTKIVSSIFGLEKIWSQCRSSDISDARTSIVSVLYYDMGINMVQISSLTGLSASGVCYLVNRLSERMKQNFMFRKLHERVRQEVFSKIIETS